MNCIKDGYGFVKKNINLEKIINSGYHIKNGGDIPSIKGFFYNFKNNVNKNTYVFLINQNSDVN